MKQITKNDKLKLKELNKLADKSYYQLVKAVVDIKLAKMVIDAPLHSDQEQELMKTGSRQENLWGINLYPDKYGTDDFIEFDSMINLRPNQGNFSRGIDNPKIRQQIKIIVNNLIKNE